MRKLRISGEIEVPDYVAIAIAEAYRDENTGYGRYTVNFRATVDEFTKYSVDIPIDLRQIIE